MPEHRHRPRRRGGAPPVPGVTGGGGSHGAVILLPMHPGVRGTAGDVHAPRGGGHGWGRPCTPGLGDMAGDTHAPPRVCTAAVCSLRAGRAALAGTDRGLRPPSPAPCSPPAPRRVPLGTPRDGCPCAAGGRAAPALSPQLPGAPRRYLQDLHVGQVVGADLAAVHLDVLQPLDVGLGITVDLAEELHVAAHQCCGVGGQPSLQDGSVRGPLCTEETRAVSPTQWPRAGAPSSLPLCPLRSYGKPFPDSRADQCNHSLVSIPTTLG